MDNTSVCLITGVLLSSLLFAGKGHAWVPGGNGGDVDMGGTITPSGPVNPWEVAVGDAVTGLDMVLPAGGTVGRYRLKQSMPVLGIRTTTGRNDTFAGETAGGIAPQITYSGVLPGVREYGRIPLALAVTRADDGTPLGVLHLSLMCGAEVSQKDPVTNTGRRYSVWAGQAGEAFYGGIARTPDEAMEYAFMEVESAFAEYVLRYNTQGLMGRPGMKQSVTLRDAGMRYSGFYGAFLAQGDEIVLQTESVPAARVTWKANLTVAVEYW
ncbi:F4 family fimbrial subunit [Citrobacter portucalensis]|uniref:F4 family fimbrial subunit n=1 Tax=Citrobacter portucalensis TaxID=1639133 RepID=UPI0028890826|nr:hypothetical protein [Citrobacter portucalensis]WNI84214.1 hypothetical protein RIK60_00980 [Citrobacter portucalensis]